jgi:hypothetical protein
MNDLMKLRSAPDLAALTKPKATRAIASSSMSSMHESDNTSMKSSALSKSVSHVSQPRAHVEKTTFDFDAWSPAKLILLGMKDPQALTATLLRLPIKQFFRSGIRYRTLINVMVCFCVLFLLQLRYSAKTRGWTRSVAQAVIFGITFFGLFFTLVVAAIKFQLHQKHRGKLLSLQPEMARIPLQQVKERTVNRPSKVMTADQKFFLDEDRLN